MGCPVTFITVILVKIFYMLLITPRSIVANAVVTNMISSTTLTYCLSSLI